jgi:ubiquinone biosynthesis protein
MDDTAATLLKHRDRSREVAAVLARHGLAAWAARGSDLAEVGPVDRLVRRTVTPEELEATDGQRLRGALTDLGTTYIKFGQMLSLRPDLVGEDIANELATLQALVPADPPGVAQRNASCGPSPLIWRRVIRRSPNSGPRSLSTSSRR